MSKVIEKNKKTDIELQIRKKIKKMKDTLYHLLEYHLKIEKIDEIDSNVYNLIRNYQLGPKIFSEDKNRLEQAITDIKKGLTLVKKGFHKSEQYNLASLNPFISHNHSQIISLLQKELDGYKETLDFIKFYKKIKYSHLDTKLSAILYLFREGEKLGLKVLGSPQGGKGKKNQFFEFINIFTEVKNRTTFNKYLVQYKQWKKENSI